MRQWQANKRGARPNRPSQVAREVRLYKELKAKHEETLLTLERTKTKLEVTEQEQKKTEQELQKVMALHLQHLDGLDAFGKQVQALTTRNEELGQKLKEAITIQKEEMKEMAVMKDKARSQCLDGMLF